jgi:hypothetical protein
LPGKRLYISPELASQFEKSGGVGLWILGVDIKPLIGCGKLGAQALEKTQFRF